MPSCDWPFPLQLYNNLVLAYVLSDRLSRLFSSEVERLGHMTGRAASAMRASGQARRSIVRFNQESCRSIFLVARAKASSIFGQRNDRILSTSVQELAWSPMGISKQIHDILVGVFRKEVQHAVRQDWLARSIFHVLEGHIDRFRGA